MLTEAYFTNCEVVNSKIIYEVAPFKPQAPRPDTQSSTPFHNPTPLSHIGTSPPQAYPQITPPSPAGATQNQVRKPTPIRPSNVFLSTNKGIEAPNPVSVSNTLDVVVLA
jgi:hypothetical protein